jgi:hypothetical protein
MYHMGYGCAKSKQWPSSKESAQKLGLKMAEGRDRQSAVKQAFHAPSVTP